MFPRLRELSILSENQRIGKGGGGLLGLRAQRRKEKWDRPDVREYELQVFE
jgi:hypothetical protein